MQEPVTFIWVFLLEVANLQYLGTFFSFRISLINYVIDAGIILVQKFWNGVNKPHPMTRPFKSCRSFPSKVPVPGYVIIQNNFIVCSLLFWAKSLYWMASMILFSYSKLKILFIFQRLYSQKNFFQFRKLVIRKCYDFLRFVRQPLEICMQSLWGSRIPN